MNLQQIVNKILKQYPTFRAAGEALGIDHAYLWKMSNGLKKVPSAETLKKLGIKVVKESETQYDFRTK